MDYIGVNWYTGLEVSGLGFSLLPSLSPLFTANPLNFIQTPNDPSKLADFLHYVNVDLGMPALITENGEDQTTPCFIADNLRAVAQAVAAGADVRGYFYWSLMDNYEWNHGMNLRFGLYAVSATDPSKTRTPRDAANTYAQIAQWHVVPDALLAQCDSQASDAGGE
ncbi:MAG: family 1 glycosylhydrolase [Polyangiaceae bacterium]